jgi:hypothetical protein
MKKFTSIEETTETVKILEQKPEIDTKINYYKETLLGLDGVMKAIDSRIERGYTTESFRFLGISVNKRINLDDYDKAKLILEKKRAELDLFEKKRYFEHWMTRRSEYDKKFEEMKKDCDANYDSVFKLAQEVRTYNLRLNDILNAYVNEKDDAKIKVEFYLYIKQEVENAIKNGKLKVALPKSV